MNWCSWFEKSEQKGQGNAGGVLCIMCWSLCTAPLSCHCLDLAGLALGSWLFALLLQQLLFLWLLVHLVTFWMLFLKWNPSSVADAVPLMSIKVLLTSCICHLEWCSRLGSGICRWTCLSSELGRDWQEVLIQDCRFPNFIRWFFLSETEGTKHWVCCLPPEYFQQLLICFSNLQITLV